MSRSSSSLELPRLYQLTLSPILASVGRFANTAKRPLVSSEHSGAGSDWTCDGADAGDVRSLLTIISRRIRLRRLGRLAVMCWLRLNSLSRRRPMVVLRAELAGRRVSLLNRERTTSESISKASQMLSNENGWCVPGVITHCAASANSRRLRGFPASRARKLRVAAQTPDERATGHA